MAQLFFYFTMQGVNTKLLTPRQILIEYLKMKVDAEDWHAVSDCANDLREIEVIIGMKTKKVFVQTSFNPNYPNTTLDTELNRFHASDERFEDAK